MRWKADLRGLQNLRTPWLLCWLLSQRRTHRGIIAFERAFCAGCALENCDGCPHKNLDRIKWWLEQQTAKAFLTRKGERSGWFSMSKKQELVDKLGPIEHQAEELLEELCGNYCRYTSAASGKTGDELLDICEDCPLSRLRDLIGV